MLVRVERGSSVPISRQIAEQIRAQCISGVLRAGEALPSVRQLAQQLAVNVNTVVRVYERLAAEKLIEMRHGDGTYVLPAPGGGASPQLAQEREHFRLELEALVGRGLMLGFTAGDLRRMVSAAAVSARGTAKSAAATREAKS